jgi:predicted secreted Zn-dependent protease
MIPRSRIEWHAFAMCMHGIMVVMLPFFAAPVLAAEIEGPSIQDTVTYHDIAGNSEQALVAALKKISYAETSGDRFFAANTHWRIRWNFRVESDGRSCGLSSATTELDVDMNLPRWNPPSNAAPALVKRWNAFATAVRKHEDGHREIAIDAAYEIEAGAKKEPPQRDCAALKKRLSRAADATLREFRDKENSYDVTTMHGRTQGATFP